MSSKKKTNRIKNLYVQGENYGLIRRDGCRFKIRIERVDLNFIIFSLKN